MFWTITFEFNEGSLLFDAKTVFSFSEEIAN